LNLVFQTSLRALHFLEAAIVRTRPILGRPK
jgi:hypothetical protein